jgi:hypothetical protein
MKPTRLREHASRAEADAQADIGTGPPIRSFVTSALWWLVPAVAILLLDVPLCPVAGVLGWPCPGCGLTRAALALLGGHFAAAWRFHPLIYVVVPCVVVFGAKTILDVATRRDADTRPAVRVHDRRRDRLLSMVAGLGLALLLGVWVARAFGALGGPVAVETYGQWAKRLVKKP